MIACFVVGNILGGLVLGLFDAWITVWISRKIMNRRKQSQ